MNEMRAKAERILAWWQRGLITSQQITEWADAIIADVPSHALPRWIFDLSLMHPSKFLGVNDADYPKAAELTFQEEFRARVECANPEDKDSIRQFMLWLIGAVLGEDHDDPDVKDGYQIEHLYCDRNNERAAIIESSCSNTRTPVTK